jgi:hypothetical protein
MIYFPYTKLWVLDCKKGIQRFQYWVLMSVCLVGFAFFLLMVQSLGFGLETMDDILLDVTCGIKTFFIGVTAGLSSFVWLMGLLC